MVKTCPILLPFDFNQLVPNIMSHGSVMVTVMFLLQKQQQNSDTSFLTCSLDNEGNNDEQKTLALSLMSTRRSKNEIIPGLVFRKQRTSTCNFFLKHRIWHQKN